MTINRKVTILSVDSITSGGFDWYEEGVFTESMLDQEKANTDSHAWNENIFHYEVEVPAHIVGEELTTYILEHGLDDLMLGGYPMTSEEWKTILQDQGN